MADNTLTDLALSQEPTLDNSLEKVLARDPETGDIKELELSGVIPTTPSLQEVLETESTATVSTDIVMQHINGGAASEIALTDDFVAISAGDNTFSMNDTSAQIDSPLTVATATEPGHAVRLDQLEAATAGAFVPLGGTESGSPVTGNIEVVWASGKGLISKETESSYNGIIFEDQARFVYSDTTLDAYTSISPVGTTVEVIGNEGYFTGVTYFEDYSANYTNRSLVDKEYVDGLAGIPLSGTASGSPVTGDVEFEDGYGELGFIKKTTDEDFLGRIAINDNSIQFTVSDLDGNTNQTQLTVSKADGNLSIGSNVSGIKGIIGVQDFSANNDGTDRNIYVQEGRMQDYVGTTSGNDIEYVGDIYNKTTWTNLADFDTPTATVAVVSNKLSFTGGANDYSQTLAHNFFTNRDKSTYKLTFEANEKSATSYGVAVTFGRTPFRVKFDMTNGVDSGKVSVANPTAGATSSTALVWASGDVISMTVDRVADLVTVTLKNETTPTANVVLNYTFSHLTVAMPNTAKIAIAHLGGTLSVTGIEYSSTELNKPTVMFIGDSKQQGYSPTFIEETFSRRFIRYIGNGVIHAGQGDRTIDVLNSMPEILAMAPKEVYFGIGSNDPRTGVPYSTYTANYASIVSQLTAAGIKVWHLLPIYEPSGLNQVPLRDFIVSTYSADDIIDLYTPSSTFVGGWYDTIHLNSLLNNAMYKVLVSANKTRPGKSVSYDTEYNSEVIDTTPSTSTTLAYSAAATNLLLTSKASLAGNTFTAGQTVLGNVTANGFLPPSTATGLLGTSSLAWGTSAIINGVFTRVKPFSGANLSITDNANTIGITVFNGTANVGVGTATPQTEKLYVAGTFRSTGEATVATPTVSTSATTKAYVDAGNSAYVAKTANYTLTTADNFVDLTANSATLTLPTAVGIAGKTYSVKNSGSGTTLTLATISSQTIDGVTTKTYNTQYSGVTVISDGANWKIKM